MSYDFVTRLYLEDS